MFQTLFPFPVKAHALPWSPYFTTFLLLLLKLETEPYPKKVFLALLICSELIMAMVVLLARCESYKLCCADLIELVDGDLVLALATLAGLLGASYARGRGGGGADSGVDLGQNVAADHHRPGLRVVHVGRDDGPAARELHAHGA